MKYGEERKGEIFYIKNAKTKNWEKNLKGEMRSDSVTSVGEPACRSHRSSRLGGTGIARGWSLQLSVSFVKMQGMVGT